ncbi:MAG: type II secretion system F family protein [Planctomycetales bacterium]|nr:type II secretion system F family protein [Planctomycetales bacterium]
MAEALIAAALVALVLLALGGGMVTTAYLIRTYHLPHRPLAYRPVLLGLAVALFGAGPGTFLVSVSVSLLAGPVSGDDVQIFVLWGIMAAMVGGISLLFLLTWQDGRNPQSHVDEQRLQRSVRTMQVIGWVIVGLTVGTIGLGLVLPPVLLGFAGIYVWGNHRRAQQANLLWMLAIATDKSIPLPDEVDAFAATIWGPRRGRCVLLADMLRNGTPLPNCLEAIPGLIPKSVVPAIHLGAAAGQISRALRDAAVRQTNDLQESSLFRTISYTSFYVWGLLTAISGIVGFLMMWIVPKFKAIFDGFEMELPAITVELIGRSDMATKYFFLTLPGLSLPFFMLIIVGLGHVFGWDALDLPLLSWFPRLETPLVLRGLSRVVSAGLPLPDGLRVLSEHHHRLGIRAKVDRLRYFVERGANCWERLQFEGFLRRGEVALLQSAQRIGNLPWVLNELADVIERRQQRRTIYAAQLIQPVFVVLMGIVVGYICVAFFMPVIKVIHGLS